MSKPTQKEHKSTAELFALVIEQAPQLIAAGVTSLSVDGLVVCLAASVPSPVTAVPAPKETVAPSHIDPLRDAATYLGGRVPGFTREDEIP